MTNGPLPSYHDLADGEFRRRLASVGARMESCDLCPRKCQVNRMAGETGTCQTGDRAMVASAGPHFGEEAPLVGSRGSGTIFFAGCNLLCVFCQNFDISFYPEKTGREMDPKEIGQIMLRLSRLGCHNVNLVTPTHVVGPLLEAVWWARKRGFNLPIVYNCGGYESVESLRLLEGVVDIYMPDFKYWDPEIAARLSGASDYPAKARAALREMHRQVGDLEIGDDGVAIRGLLVRHLVLPDEMAGTPEITRFLAEEISPQTFINIMGQYRPAHRSAEHPPLERRVARREVLRARRQASRAGLTRIYH